MPTRFRVAVNGHLKIASSDPLLQYVFQLGRDLQLIHAGCLMSFRLAGEVAHGVRSAGVSLQRLGLANSKNNARSRREFFAGRLSSHPPIMAFPDEFKTRHSHLDRPRFLTTTSSIKR
jgi:hypothetical protein